MTVTISVSEQTRRHRERWILCAKTTPYLTPQARLLLESMGQRVDATGRVLASHRDIYRWSGLNRPTILATIEGLAERRILLSGARVELSRVWWTIHPKTSSASKPEPLPVIYFPILGQGV
jgi:hypothetical protein